MPEQLYPGLEAVLQAWDQESGEWAGRGIGVGLKESFYLRPSFYPKTHPVF